MSKQTALVTGISGFVGGHLTEYLVGQGVSVVGVIRAGGHQPSHPVNLGSVEIEELDLNDGDQVAACIERVRPEFIFHLAAQSFVPQSWSDPAGTIVNNILVQLRVLEGTLRANVRPRIVIAGSNEEYGMIHPDELPVRESNELRPVSPYAVSKVAQDMLGYQFYASHKLHCVRMRPFNHTGPGQSSSFAVPGFARQVAEAEVGLREPIVRVGNLSARRDITDVRDIVRAYYLAALHGQAGEVYNLGSGRAISMADVLQFFVSRSACPLTIVDDPERQRPADVPVTICDYSKFHALTGWQPQIPIERTFEDVLEYWRSQVRMATDL
ncbi:MAG: NAD-dependent epimerase/dehydratase family protein [Chloroflexota bacterium]|nr:MAG: NAD-dependent epimerase/dehydratase family protein [Chloroflexota bacterium]